MAVYTIGHSTRDLEEFVRLLRGFGVTLLADVRTVPRSRREPQFNRETLPGELATRGIGYRHLEKLGGLRHSRKDSVNGGWENRSFRGYADYMQTEGFAGGIEELAALTRDHTVAIMCAEAVPWRCHRRMVGDALLVRGFEVFDIMGEDRADPERLTDFAVVDGTTITYPPPSGDG